MLVAPSCLTLSDPVDYSPPGSSVHEIFQARILEWVAISFSRGEGIEPGSPALQADSLPTELLSSVSAFAVRIFEMALRDKVFSVTYVTWMSAGVPLPSEIQRGLIQTSHPYHT